MKIKPNRNSQEQPARQLPAATPDTGKNPKTKVASQTKSKKILKRVPVVDIHLLKKGTISNGIGEPNKIVTRRLKRNIVISAILGVAAVGALVYYLIFGLGLLSNLASNPAVTAALDITEFEARTNNGVEGAKATISAYYDLLEAGDAQALREAGYEDAANAMSMKWLSAINYSVSASAVDANVAEMPKSVGVYAGNDVYKISDFMTQPPVNVVSSSITGNTGCEGWVYYDSDNMRWVVVDPTIPTATQAAEAGVVVSSSEDNTVTVNLQCSGAYSNPWWSFAMMSVDIASANTEDSVVVEKRTLDEGMTTIVPDTLLGGCAPATKTTLPQEGGDQQTGASSISVVKAKGICCIYRGVLEGFATDRIGAAALRIDGNVCPVSISVGEYDITPAFAIGTAASEDILRLLNEEERERYGASESNVQQAQNEVNTLTNEAASHPVLIQETTSN